MNRAGLCGHTLPSISIRSLRSLLTTWLSEHRLQSSGNMSRLATPLTQLLGCRVPVVCAPMAGATGGLLAAAVHKGGGFGILSAVRVFCAAQAIGPTTAC